MKAVYLLGHTQALMPIMKNSPVKDLPPCLLVRYHARGSEAYIEFIDTDGVLHQNPWETIVSHGFARYCETKYIVKFKYLDIKNKSGDDMIIPYALHEKQIKDIQGNDKWMMCYTSGIIHHKIWVGTLLTLQLFDYDGIIRNQKPTNDKYHPSLMIKDQMQQESNIFDDDDSQSED